jgi:hypothetical protein
MTAFIFLWLSCRGLLGLEARVNMLFSQGCFKKSWLQVLYTGLTYCRV